MIGKASVAGQPSHALLIGGVPHEQVSELYKLADIFVIPSLMEARPLTLSEAFFNGPVGQPPYFLVELKHSAVETGHQAGIPGIAMTESEQLAARTRPDPLSLGAVCWASEQRLAGSPGSKAA